MSATTCKRRRHISHGGTKGHPPKHSFMRSCPLAKSYATDKVCKSTYFKHCLLTSQVSSSAPEERRTARAARSSSTLFPA